MNADILILAALAFAGGFAQTTTGFGFVVIVLSLGAHVRPMDDLVPLLVGVALVIAAHVALRNRRDVRWAVILTRVAPAMAAGTLVGQLVFHHVAGPWLAKAFGGLVAVLAAVELLRRDAPKPLAPPVAAATLVGAGVVHGIYGAGGPPLVWVLSRTPLSKAEFRATISGVLVLLDAALVAVYAATGRLSAADVPEMAVFLAAATAAYPLGERVHARIPVAGFRKALFVVLLGAGLSLLR